jgi:transposase-like protein
MAFEDIAEHLPRAATFDFSNCRCEHVRRSGFAANGERQLRCPVCGRVFMETYAPGRCTRGSHLRSIGTYFLRGATAAECARDLKLNVNTVYFTYRRIVRLLRKCPEFRARLDLRAAWRPGRNRRSILARKRKNL